MQPSDVSNREREGSTVALSLKLPLDVDAPGTARATLMGLRERLEAPAYEDLRLLVSELVTNSIQHSADADWVRLEIELFAHTVRVSVADPGPGFRPSSGVPTAEQLSGRGLYLVGLLADRWGVSRRGKTRVWFEMQTEGRDAVGLAPSDAPAAARRR